jgi:cysteine synthase
MIDLTMNRKQMEANAKYCRERKIKIPTFAQMKDPSKIPASIKEELKGIGLWDIHPRNLFRISWKNQPTEKGGGFGDVNYIVLPSELTGVKAKIIMITGKWFPTGAHKVGATFGCLVPKLVTGQFNPATDKAAWPSTGNFCRGGAYVSALMGCGSIAILPENMSRERFEWLKKVAGEVIATHGCESNVKEIFDKCWELKKTRPGVNIFNQFEELGNPMWHYNVTGSAMEEALLKEMGTTGNLAGAVYSSGSAGTLGSGNYLKDRFPRCKVVAAEALQCPTLLNNGFGDHRIEGIGDKHIPWIHDVKSTDMVVAVDDEVAIRTLRLFNEKQGRAHLNKMGVSTEVTSKLDLLGISGIGNMIGAIKFAKYNELTENDYVISVATDSMQLYGSRLAELAEQKGQYTDFDAHKDAELLHHGVLTDSMLELNYQEKKRVHNLKYFTWIEQQEKDLKELNAQWYDHKGYWDQLKMASKIDEMILEFNSMIGE